MTERLKARRVRGGTPPLVYALIGVVLFLIVVIAVLLFSDGFFSNEPKSQAERDYQLLLAGLKENPEDPAVLMTIAEVEMDLGKESEAREHAEKAWEFGSETPGIPFRYAQVMLQLDDLEAAKKGVDKAIELDVQKGNAEPRFLLAQITRAEGDLEGAIVIMGEALEIGYMAADMRILYAEMLEEAGRTDEAIEQYKEALRYLPGDARAIDALERLGVTVEETETVNPHADDSQSGD